MSKRFDAAGEYLSRSAALPGGENCTLCGFAYAVTLSNADDRLICQLNDSVASKSFGLRFFTDVGGTPLLGLGTSAGGNAVLFTGQPTAGEWFFWAATATTAGANSCNAYCGRAGAALENVSKTGDAFTPNGLWFGYHAQFAFAQFDGRMQGLMCFDRVLTLAELECQRSRLRPVDPTSLNYWCPWDEKDYSGNGRDLTVTGTVTDEDGPPVGYGAPILMPPSYVTPPPAAFAVPLGMFDPIMRKECWFDEVFA